MRTPSRLAGSRLTPPSKWSRTSANISAWPMLSPIGPRSRTAHSDRTPASQAPDFPERPAPQHALASRVLLQVAGRERESPQLSSSGTVAETCACLDHTHLESRTTTLIQATLRAQC